MVIKRLRLNDLKTRQNLRLITLDWWEEECENLKQTLISKVLALTSKPFWLVDSIILSSKSKYLSGTKFCCLFSVLLNIKSHKIGLTPVLIYIGTGYYVCLSPSFSLPFSSFRFLQSFLSPYLTFGGPAGCGIMGFFQSGPNGL